MKTVIIGPKSSGKSTLFSALCKNATIHHEFSMGMIKVRDPRVDKLSEMFIPKKITYNETTVVDLNGDLFLSSTEGFSSKVIEYIKKSDAVIGVTNVYFDEPPERKKNIQSQLAGIESELILTDLMMIEQRIKRVTKENPKSPDLPILERMHLHLNDEKALRFFSLTESEQKLLVQYNFVSMKPILYVVNRNETNLNDDEKQIMSTFAETTKSCVVDLCAKVEAELNELEKAEQQSFLEALGLTRPASDVLIDTLYTLLGLISFFTVGKDEVKSWQIERNDKALKAASRIHSDIARGFICAEVISYDDFVQCGSLVEAKKVGKLRLEGKEYIVKDGDIINFRFNV